MDRVGADGLEPEAEIIVEAIRRHGGFPAVEGLLVHLEGAGQMLGVAHHDHGNVADQDRSFDRGLLLGVQIAEQVPQRIGLRGPVDDQMDLQTACFDLCDVGVDLGTRFGVTFFVDDDGETAV